MGSARGQVGVSQRSGRDQPGVTRGSGRGSAVVFTVFETFLNGQTVFRYGSKSVLTDFARACILNYRKKCARVGYNPTKKACGMLLLYYVYNACSYCAMLYVTAL